MFLDCIVHHFFIVAVDDGEAVSVCVPLAIPADNLFQQGQIRAAHPLDDVPTNVVDASGETS